MKPILFFLSTMSSENGKMEWKDPKQEYFSFEGPSSIENNLFQHFRFVFYVDSWKVNRIIKFLTCSSTIAQFLFILIFGNQTSKLVYVIVFKKIQLKSSQRRRYSHFSWKTDAFWICKIFQISPTYLKWFAKCFTENSVE